MKERVLRIYQELYQSPKAKDYFSELFEVTTKSIENTMKKLKEDIVYDRKLKRYRFKELLPRLIPSETFFYILQDSIANQVIKKDILSISKLLYLNSTEKMPSLMPTESLSFLTKNIIMSHVAIRHNCILKISYTGIGKPIETKYIKPHKITSTGFIYYLYGSYEKRNKKNIDEARSFAFNSISEMLVVEYLKDENLLIDGKSNAFGLINKEKYIILNLQSSAADFFKREKQFEREEFEFLSEGIDGKIVIRMYYNNLDEIIYLLSRWMPLITVDSSSVEKEEIYKIIKKNCRELIGNVDAGEDDES